MLVTTSTVVPTVTNQNIVTTVSQTSSWRTSTSTSTLPPTTTSTTLPSTTSTTMSTTSTTTTTTSTTTFRTTTKLTTLNPFERAFQPPIETIHNYDYDSSNQEKVIFLVCGLFEKYTRISGREITFIRITWTEKCSELTDLSPVHRLTFIVMVVVSQDSTYIKRLSPKLFT